LRKVGYGNGCPHHGDAVTPEREQELRQGITAVLCHGCARRDPIDENGRHVHSYQQEAFGDTWDSRIWFSCAATPLLVELWFAFVAQAINSELLEFAIASDAYWCSHYFVLFFLAGAIPSSRASQRIIAAARMGTLWKRKLHGGKLQTPRRSVK
jgi:hypothetical protein